MWSGVFKPSITLEFYVEFIRGTDVNDRTWFSCKFLGLYILMVARKKVNYDIIFTEGLYI